MLLDNPFSILGVNPRSKRADIMAAAEEKMLDGNATEIQRSRTVLLNPRQRLAAEVSFLGSIPSSKSKKLLSLLEKKGYETESLSLEGLPDLAVLNLGVTLLSGEKSFKKGHIRLISQMLASENRLSIVKLQREIDSERTAAGFPPVGDEQALRQSWQEHLEKVSKKLIQLMDSAPNPSKTLSTLLEENEDNTGALLHDLIIAYASNPYLLESLEKLKDSMLQTCEDICEQSADGRATTKFESYLMESLDLWLELNNPTQTLSEREGGDSNAVDGLVMSLREGLFDLHKHTSGAAKQKTLYEQIMEKAGSSARSGLQLVKDVEELDAMATEEDGENVSIEFGNHSLQIHKNILSFKGEKVALKDVTDIRFGSYHQTVNLIPVERSHAVWLSHDRGELKIECLLTLEGWEKGHKRFMEVLEALWRPVVARLSLEIYLRLKEGETIEVGGIELTEEGVLLRQKGLFKVKRAVVPWSRLNVMFSQGTAVLRDVQDQSFREDLNLRDTPNAVLLEMVGKAMVK